MAAGSRSMEPEVVLMDLLRQSRFLFQEEKLHKDDPSTFAIEPELLDVDHRPRG